MKKYRAAAPGNPRAAIVINFYNQIIEMVLARKPVPGAAGRHLDASIVARVGRILAPGVIWSDPPYRQPSGRPRAAFRVPPQANKTETAARGRPIALPLVRQNAAPAESDRKNMRTGGEQPTAARRRRGADP